MPVEAGNCGDDAARPLLTSLVPTPLHATRDVQRLIKNQAWFGQNTVEFAHEAGVGNLICDAMVDQKITERHETSVQCHLSKNIQVAVKQTKSHNPAAIMRPYPTVITTTNVMMLAGTPRVMKCLTFKYRWPVWLSSIMIAAEDYVSDGEQGLEEAGLTHVREAAGR